MPGRHHPAAFSYHSVPVLDAIRVRMPIVEVHTPTFTARASGARNRSDRRSDRNDYRPRIHVTTALETSPTPRASASET